MAVSWTINSLVIERGLPDFLKLTTGFFTGIDLAYCKEEMVFHFSGVAPRTLVAGQYLETTRVNSPYVRQVAFRQNYKTHRV